MTYLAGCGVSREDSSPYFQRWYDKNSYLSVANEYTVLPPVRYSTTRSRRPHIMLVLSVI